MQSHTLGIDCGNACGSSNDGVFMGAAADGVQKCCFSGSGLSCQKQMTAGAVYKPGGHGGGVVIPLGHIYKV
jgi:hypothetical protein